VEAEITLRPAASADIPAILEIQAHGPEAAGWSPDDYRKLFSSGGAVCLLALKPEAGPAVGFLLARHAADEMEILNLAVLPAQRRRGAARRLVEAALTQAAARGARTCWLEVRASNQGARSFYAALGFIEQQLRPDYYRDPLEDAVVCARPLAPAP